MAEIARIRWQSPPPTSVDEELVVYDDATALLVVRTSRDGSPVIGTWTATVAAEDLAVLEGQRREMDLRHPDRWTRWSRPRTGRRRRPRDTRWPRPRSTQAWCRPAGWRCWLSAAAPPRGLRAGRRLGRHPSRGRGNRGRLAPDGAAADRVRVTRARGPGRRRAAGRDRAGRVRRIALAGPPLDEAGAVTFIEVAGYLRDGLPEHTSYQRFTCAPRPSRCRAEP